MKLSEYKQLLKRLASKLQKKEIEMVLADDANKNELFAFADSVRQKHAGDGVFLRGVIEFSNYCRNTCAYCGLNKNNTKLNRYRLPYKEILGGVEKIFNCGIKTVVLQSGEDDDFDVIRFAQLITQIKKNYGIAVTLSVGERSDEEYKLWRDAGADRYLLKIETTDERLYAKLHPFKKGANEMRYENRLRCLEVLRKLGYQVGSGIIIGFKDQTVSSIARDIIFFKKNDFDMIGIGPFIPHSCTELGSARPGDVDLTLKTIAVTRIVTKNSHIPATTALGSVEKKDYRVDGLKCGANVLMPNFTPQPYRKYYEIYPEKRCINEMAGECAFCMENMVKSIGRYIDYSVGDSLKS